MAGLIPFFRDGGRLQSGFDLNGLFDFGIYSFTSGDVSNAATEGASVLIVYGYAAARVLQIQLTLNGTIHSRFYTNSWSTWRPI